MDPRIAPLMGQFNVATNLFRRAIAGVEEEALHRQPGPDSNPMIWIAGHLTQFRCRIVRLVGSDRPVPWEDLFRTGSSLHDPSAYPSIQVIEALWTDVADELAWRLQALTSEELDEPPTARVPSIDGTVGGALTYFAFHEGYHVGQLGYVRKWLEYPPLLDG